MSRIKRQTRLEGVEVRRTDPADWAARARSAWRRLSAEGAGAVLDHARGLARLAFQRALYRWTPRRWTHRLDSIPIDRPIFVVGVPGGGGTILARCFHRHPDVVYATGNSSYWGSDGEMHNARQVVRDLPESLVLRSAHFRNVDRGMERHPVYGYQRSPMYAMDEFLPRYRKTEDQLDEDTTRRFRRVIRRVLLAYAHDPRRARLFDMSQLYTLQIPRIAAMLPDARPMFVLLSRNPYVWCRRTVQKDLSGLGTTRELTRDEKVRCAVEAWSNSYRIALEARDRVRMLHVRAEDFVADCESVVRRICDFVGLEFRAEQLPGPGQPLPPGSHSLEKWFPLRPAPEPRAFLEDSADIVSAVNRRCPDLVEQLGYERL